MPIYTGNFLLNLSSNFHCNFSHSLAATPNCRSELVAILVWFRHDLSAEVSNNLKTWYNLAATKIVREITTKIAPKITCALLFRSVWCIWNNENLQVKIYIHNISSPCLMENWNSALSMHVASLNKSIFRCISFQYASHPKNKIFFWQENTKHGN